MKPHFVTDETARRLTARMFSELQAGLPTAAALERKAQRAVQGAGSSVRVINKVRQVLDNTLCPQFGALPDKSGHFMQTIVVTGEHEERGWLLTFRSITAAVSSRKGCWVRLHPPTVSFTAHAVQRFMQRAYLLGRDPVIASVMYSALYADRYGQARRAGLPIRQAVLPADEGAFLGLVQERPRTGSPGERLDDLSHVLIKTYIPDGRPAVDRLKQVLYDIEENPVMRGPNTVTNMKEREVVVVTALRAYVAAHPWLLHAHVEVDEPGTLD